MVQRSQDRYREAGKWALSPFWNKWKYLKSTEGSLFFCIIFFFLFKGSESFTLRKQAKETLQVALILEKNSIHWVHPLQDAKGEGRAETVTMMMMMTMIVMTKLMKMPALAGEFFTTSATWEAP